MNEFLIDQLNKLAYDKQKAREARGYNGPEDLPHGKDIMNDFEEIMRYNPALRFKLEEIMDRADLREHPDRDKLRMADNASNSAALKGVFAGGAVGAALPLLAHKRIGGMENASALAMLLSPVGMLAGGNIGAATQLKKYDGIDIDGIKGEDKNYLRFLANSVPENTRQDILKQKEVELQERQLREYQNYNRQRIAAELQKAEAMRGLSTSKTASELVEYLEKVAGVSSVVDDIVEATKRFGRDVSGKTLNDATAKLDEEELKELGFKVLEPIRYAGVDDYYHYAPYSENPLLRFSKKNHHERIQLAYQAQKKARNQAAAVAGAGAGFGAGVYGGSKLYDHLTKPKIEEKVASEESPGYNPNWDLLMASLLGFSGTSLGMKAARTEEGIGRITNALQGVGLGVAAGTPYMADYFNAKAGETEKTASIARKAVDVLTGKAKANAGQEVLKASEYLKDVAAKKDTVRGALSEFNSDIVAARDGAKMLEHGQEKKTALEELLAQARKRKLDTIETGISNRRRGNIDYITDGELDADKVFNDTKARYDEYVNDLHTRANKPLVDKMTPEFIASQKDDYVNRLSGLNDELSNQQGVVQDLQKNYKKQRALQYGSYGAIGAGTVAALPKKPNRPYTEGTQAANTFDPMMYDMGQIDQIASEQEYLEKIAFAAGLISAGSRALGMAGKAGSRALGMAGQAAAPVGQAFGQMGVNNALARKAGQGIIGDSVGQTLKNVGSRVGGYVGDVTGQSRKVLDQGVKQNAAAFRKADSNLKKIDGALENEMASKYTNFDKVKKIENAQLKTMQDATNSENALYNLAGARGAVNKARDKARVGLVLGGAGLAVGNGIQNSMEIDKMQQQYEKQQF